MTQHIQRSCLAQIPLNKHHSNETNTLCCSINQKPETNTHIHALAYTHKRTRTRAHGRVHIIFEDLSKKHVITLRKPNPKRTSNWIIMRDDRRKLFFGGAVGMIHSYFLFSNQRSTDDHPHSTQSLFRSTDQPTPTAIQYTHLNSMERVGECVAENER